MTTPHADSIRWTIQRPATVQREILHVLLAAPEAEVVPQLVTIACREANEAAIARDALAYEIWARTWRHVP